MARKKTLTLVSTADDLARWQTAYVLKEMQLAGVGDWQKEEITLPPEMDSGAEDGDEKRVQPLLKAVADGVVDAAVVGAIDLPHKLPNDLTVAAALPRGVVNAALICHTHIGFQDLPRDAKVGTSSPRRSGQLRLLRSDITILPLEGDVHYRLSKIDAAQLDAVLVPWVDLRRLGLAWRVDDVFGLTELLPQPKHAVTAVVTRTKDAPLNESLVLINHVSTLRRLKAEMAFLDNLEMETGVGVGALASDYGREGMRFVARMVAADGSWMNEVERNIQQEEEPEELGRKVAVEMNEREKKR